MEWGANQGEKNGGGKKRRRGRNESERGTRGRTEQRLETVGEREGEKERNRAETGRGRQTKLGQVT